MEPTTTTTPAAAPVTWARGSYRTAYHITLPGRRTACGTHLGYGQLEHLDTEHQHTWVRLCGKCTAR